MLRKLASIQKIIDVQPIDNADFIELVTINGWTCITKKGEFQRHDLCVYFEIDSFLPIQERYEFLRKSSYKKMKINGKESEGFRLKTMKMKGEISQGLALPISLFPEIKNPKKGEDVTKTLNVLKYEPELNIKKSAKIGGEFIGEFPLHFPKSQQERVQNLIWYFDKYKEMEWEETLKLDGTSMTAFFVHDKKYFNARRNFIKKWWYEYAVKIFDRPFFAKHYKVMYERAKQYKNAIITNKYLGNVTKGQFGVCSRNYELKVDDTNALWKTAINLKLPELMQEYCVSENVNISIQGELMGPGIQKNRENFDDFKFFVYDIYDIDAQKHWTPEQRRVFIEGLKVHKNSDIQHVPVINENIRIFEEVTNVKDMLNRAEGESINHKVREGLVFKSSCGSISFKAISNKFLLKEDI